MQGIIDMFTDPNFLHSSYKLNNYLVKQEVPVYQYMFNYQGTVYTYKDSTSQEFIRNDRRKELLYYVNLIRAC